MMLCSLEAKNHAKSIRVIIDLRVLIQRGYLKMKLKRRESSVNGFETTVSNIFACSVSFRTALVIIEQEVNRESASCSKRLLIRPRELLGGLH